MATINLNAGITNVDNSPYMGVAAVGAVGITPGGTVQLKVGNVLAQILAASNATSAAEAQAIWGDAGNIYAWTNENSTSATIADADMLYIWEAVDSLAHNYTVLVLGQVVTQLGTRPTS